MENINLIVGNNLQSIRKEKQLTLQEVAELTGVSKSMLGEIERGAASPTITVLWKIVSGLKIHLTDLISEETPKCSLIKEKDWKTFIEEDFYKMSLIIDYDPSKNFEVHNIEFSPDSNYESKGHQKGVIEYIFVYEGCMTITLKKTKYRIDKGDSFVFGGDEPHSYSNESDKIVKAYTIICYPPTKDKTFR